MTATVISLATKRPPRPGLRWTEERPRAIGALQERLSPGDIVYVVLREQRADACVCDFFLIQGHYVACITQDITRAIGRSDQPAQRGLLISGAADRDVFGELVDSYLSRLLFGAPDEIRYQIIR